MKILVTGGAGFIGSHLVDALVRQGHAVTVLDNFEPQVHQGRRPPYLNSEAEYIEGDVRNRDTWISLLRRNEVVFHEAASVGVAQSMYQISKYIDVNTLGTAYLCDCLVNERHSIRKCIIASSMSIYGEGTYRCPDCGEIYPSLRAESQLILRKWEAECPLCGKTVTPVATTENKPLMATSIYALSKKDQEEMCMMIGVSYKIPVVALRYFNVYGPRQSLSNPYTGACAIFLSRIKNKKPPLIFEDGLQARDFVYVDDIVRANLLALSDTRFDYGIFNVGTGRLTTILDIANTLITLTGERVDPTVEHKFRIGDIRHCYADISKITALGYAPSVTLAEGFKELLAGTRDVKAEDRIEVAQQELNRRSLIR